jgi:rSAM/selenodomain-associated transferase 2
MTTVSLIVPVFHDRAAAARLFQQIHANSAIELIVADGGADDELERLVRNLTIAARYIRAPKGRARQMNAAARLASGEWLLFLHADSQLPVDWLDVLTTRARGAGGGWFRFALDDPAWQARLIELGVRWRVRLLRLPYGDQGIFVRRTVFTALDGFRDLPLMEDVDFVRRLVKRERVVEVPAAIVTSARRWHADGWLRRSVRNLTLLTLYSLGVSAERLARWYE